MSLHLSQDEHAEFLWWAREAEIMSDRELIEILDAAQRQCLHGHYMQAWCRPVEP